MSLTVQAFRFAAEPFFFSKVADKNSPELFARVNHYFVVVACTIMIGICLNLEWLKYFINANYWEGLSIVPVLLMGQVFLGIYYNVSIWFKITDKTQFGTYITIGGALLTVALNYLLIPQFGIMGSSAVSLICYLAMTAVCYWIGQRYFPVPYTVGRDVLILITTTLIVWLNEQLVVENYFVSIAVRGILSLVILWTAYKITFQESVRS
jgi:O-antigen/teichoic acid export membrane protein